MKKVKSMLLSRLLYRWLAESEGGTKIGRMMIKMLARVTSADPRLNVGLPVNLSGFSMSKIL